MRRIVPVLLSLTAIIGLVQPAIAAQSYLTFSSPPDSRWVLGPGPATVFIRWNNCAAADTDAVHSLYGAYPTGSDTTYYFSAGESAVLRGGTVWPRIPICRTIDLSIQDINGANDAGIKNVAIVLTGTNMLGETITQTYTPTDNTESVIAGTTAFATLTSIKIPKMDDNGAAVSVGLGDDLGLPFTMPGKYCLGAWYGGVVGTATITVDVTDIEKNIFTVASHGPDGSVDLEAVFAVPPLAAIGTVQGR